MPASRLLPPSGAVKAIQTINSITALPGKVKRLRAHGGLVMGIKKWTERAMPAVHGEMPEFVLIPRRLLFRNHGGDAVSRVRKHRRRRLALDSAAAK